MPDTTLDDAADAAETAAETLDIRATAAMAAHRDKPAVKLLGRLSQLADQPPLFALGGGVLLLGLVRRSGREVEAGLRILAAEALATAVKSAVKGRVARSRPSSVLSGEGYRAEGGAPEGKGEQSFPSGHTAGAVAVAGVLAPLYPGAALPMAGVAGLVAVAQPLKAAHFLVDVAVGAAIGAVSAAAVDGAAAAIRSAARR